MDIAFDAATQLGSQSNSGNFSGVTHSNVGTSNLVAFVALLNTAAGSGNVTAVTYGGQTMHRDAGNSGTFETAVGQTDLWYLVNPPVGAQAISITVNAASTTYAIAFTYTGVYQGVYPVTPYEVGTPASTRSSGLVSSQSMAVTATDSKALVIMVAGDSVGDAIAGTNTTQRKYYSFAAIGLYEANATGTATVQSKRGSGTCHWTGAAVSLKPAAAAATADTSKIYVANSPVHYFSY